MPDDTRAGWRPQDEHGLRRRHGYSESERDFGAAEGGHRGKGPVSYTPTDERIREVVCEVLTDDDRVDATNIEVNVRHGEVILSGTVDDRHQKRCAEDALEHVHGIKDVSNQLRVRPHS